jgi:hypothetical protein
LSQAYVGSSKNVRRDHGLTRAAKKTVTVASRCCPSKRTILSFKNGNTRHVPLNAISLAAFQELFARSRGQGQVFVNMQGEPLKGYKHWFDPALREAGISFFTGTACAIRSRVMAGVDLRTVAELMGQWVIRRSR